MKNNKMSVRIIAVAVLAVTVLMALASCSGLSEETQMELKTKAEILAECLMNNDCKKAFGYMDKEYITESDLNTVFPQMTEYVGKFSEYEVTGPAGYKAGVNNGVSYVQATYLVDTNNKDFYIEVGAVEERNELAIFRVTLKEDADVANGVPFANVIGKSPFQIVVLAVGLASLAFAVWMLVDCIRKKIKNKVFWIIFILLGQLTVIFTTVESGSVNFNFNIGFILAISTLSISETVAVLKLVIPVGAIIYRAMRAKLIVKDAPVETTAQINASEPYESAVAENGLANDYGKVNTENEPADNNASNKEETEKAEIANNENEDENR